jgi:inhibitor of cysteine peptidase
MNNMNNGLNLMLFIGFIGFLIGFIWVALPFQSKVKSTIKPLSMVTLLGMTSLLVGCAWTASSNPSELLLPVGVQRIQNENHLRTLLQSAQEDRQFMTGNPAPGVAEDMSTTTTENKNSFVDTNSQVDGIKEGDVIKTDGEFIYYASRWDSRIRVMQVDTTNVVTYVTTINLETKDDTIFTDSMYLTEDYLVIIGYRYSLNQNSCATEDENGDVYFCADFRWWQPTGSVVLIDRQSLSIVYTLNTNSAFIDHRIVPIMNGETMLGETLYLVGHHYFYVYDNTVDLRPYYLENDLPKSYMPYASMAFVEEDNFYAMTTFTGIRLLSNPDEIEYQASGYLGTTPDYKKLYVDANHLYLAQSNYLWEDPQSYQTTTIFKFALDVANADLTLTTVGTIRGVAINQFALDAYEGMFRIATTDTVWDVRGDAWWWSWESRTITNRLYILEDLNDGTFAILGLIDEGLGKPNESIMSVRFQGPLAYVVTFLRTDPLYIIDLTNPASPLIREEIVLPGFDTYQHPWGEDFVLGFGYDADEEGQLKGMKLSAYDVREGQSDVIQTYLLNEAIFDGIAEEDRSSWQWAWSEALWDHKAITVSIDHGIFAFAVNAYQQTFIQADNTADSRGENGYYDFSYHSYYFIFAIDFTSSTPIQLIKKIEHPTSSAGYVQVDRGVIINDFIHTFSNQQMISYDLETNTIGQTLLFPEYQTA